MSCNPLKAWRASRDVLPRWAHSQGCWQEASILPWLLAGGLSSLPNRPLPRAAWMSSKRGSWFPQANYTQGSRRQKSQCLLWHNLGRDIPSRLPYPVGFAGQSWKVVEGTSIGCGYLLGTVLDAGYHSNFWYLQIHIYKTWKIILAIQAYQKIQPN